MRLVDAPQGIVRRPWSAEWVTESPCGRRTQVAPHLNTYDVAVIQHEYGIFGGPDGEDVLEVAARLPRPGGHACCTPC